MHVYPPIIQELVDLLETAGFEVILYGSTALWIQLTPRPKSQVKISDADMCVRCPATARDDTRKQILKLVNRSMANAVIDYDDPNHFFTTKDFTITFMSAGETIQISFNLQTDEEFAFTASHSSRLSILGNPTQTVAIAGLSFIAARMVAKRKGMIEVRLFRFDKRDATLMYAAMVAGCLSDQQAFYAIRPLA
jgi:hypothetical protein